MDRTVGQTAGRTAEKPPPRRHRPSTNPPGPARQPAPPDRGDPQAWLYGIHTVLAALANPRRRPRRLVATADAAGNLPPDAPDAEIVKRADLERLLPAGAVHQGIALLAEPLPEPDFDQACRPRQGRRNAVILLDQVTDPQNVGAILRSAAAFGVGAVVQTRRHAPETTGALAKAASGALESVPLVRVANLSQALDRLADLGYWRIGLDGGADSVLTDVDAGDNVALVLGAEGAGLRRLTATHCDFIARLPMQPAMQSLNVSVAAAIAMYELTRGSR